MDPLHMSNYSNREDEGAAVLRGGAPPLVPIHTIDTEQHSVTDATGPARNTQNNAADLDMELEMEEVIERPEGEGSLPKSYSKY